LAKDISESCAGVLYRRNTVKKRTRISRSERESNCNSSAERRAELAEKLVFFEGLFNVLDYSSHSALLHTPFSAHAH
jgi:hypothetical protein